MAYEWLRRWKNVKEIIWRLSMLTVPALEMWSVGSPQSGYSLGMLLPEIKLDK